MKVAVLTGGGDAPGLNAAIRAIVRKGISEYHFEIVGIKRGWAGALEWDTTPLQLDSISGILPRGGTILLTSRTNPFKIDQGPEKIKKNLSEHVDALIAIGGDDTLGVANKLFDLGVKVVGVPKTIDNDLYGTDATFGFDTAVSIVTEALDRIHTTAESHYRVMVMEVMGRDAGWIALYGGIAGGADVTLIPEKPFDVEEVCDLIRHRRARGKYFSIVVVAEGAKPKESNQVLTQSKGTDSFGHVRLGGIGESLAQEIEKRTGFETRAVVLGHTQRGGSPTANDRILATRYGLAAIDLVKEGKFGMMPALQGNHIVPIPIKDAVGQMKTVTEEFYNIAKVFFG